MTAPLTPLMGLLGSKRRTTKKKGFLDLKYVTFQERKGFKTPPLMDMMIIVQFKYGI